MVFNKGHQTENINPFSLSNLKENSGFGSWGQKPKPLTAQQEKQKEVFESTFEKLNEALDVKNPSKEDWYHREGLAGADRLPTYALYGNPSQKERNQLSIIEHLRGSKYLTNCRIAGDDPRLLEDIGYALSIVRHYEATKMTYPLARSDDFLWFGDEAYIARNLGVSRVIFNDRERFIEMRTSEPEPMFQKQWIMLITDGLTRFDYIEDDKILFSRYCLPQNQLDSFIKSSEVLIEKIYLEELRHV